MCLVYQKRGGKNIGKVEYRPTKTWHKTKNLVHQSKKRLKLEVFRTRSPINCYFDLYLHLLHLPCQTINLLRALL